MYFCKNCGEAYMTDEAVMCVRCGAPKGQGRNFCHSCGKPVQPDATVCMNCGVSAIPRAIPGAKSKLIAGLLGIFLGALGIHNFYLGYNQKAITQLVITVIGFVLSCIVIGVPVVMCMQIWGFVEGILILMGRIDTDGNGMRLGD